MTPPVRHGWVDASAGVAGDMLLAALLDAGADLEAVRAAVEAVLPRSVDLSTRTVTRGGLRALHVQVRPLVASPPERHLSDLLALVDAADGTALPGPVRARVRATFERLARAEARVHGVDVEAVHFHEVGALDSVADVVGVCAAVHDLRLAGLTCSPVALGSGRMRAAHGDLPVPGPAVTELALGWPVTAGGEGELTTPTGLALLRTLATAVEPLPTLTVETVGVGAGTRDDPRRPNVTRVLVGTPYAVSPPAPDGRPPTDEQGVVLEANVDDLDPRLWPGVLAALMAAGAQDAWLVPVLMKKGRPAHTLCVLGAVADLDRLRDVVLTRTTTFGVRHHLVTRHPLARGWLDVRVGSDRLPVKVAHRDGLVVHATPEFEPVAALAARTGTPPTDLLRAAEAATQAEGITPGATLATGRLRDSPDSQGPHG